MTSFARQSAHGTTWISTPNSASLDRGGQITPVKTHHINPALASTNLARIRYRRTKRSDTLCHHAVAKISALNEISIAYLIVKKIIVLIPFPFFSHIPIRCISNTGYTPLYHCILGKDFQSHYIRQSLDISLILFLSSHICYI